MSGCYKPGTGPKAWCRCLWLCRPASLNTAWNMGLQLYPTSHDLTQPQFPATLAGAENLVCLLPLRAIKYWMFHFFQKWVQDSPERFLRVSSKYHSLMRLLWPFSTSLAKQICISLTHPISFLFFTSKKHLSRLQSKPLLPCKAPS